MNSEDEYFLSKLPTWVYIKGERMTNTVIVDDKLLDLKGSLKVANHSPTGFNWGYGGSGSAQFALALLLRYVDKETAQRYYHKLKFGWVAGINQDDFSGWYNLQEIMKQILHKS